jgi:uncharacterized protein YodC (DUF2158 family)
MLTSTKKVSIAITALFSLGPPLSPALSASAPSNAAISDQAAPVLQNGNFVWLRSGGPLMTVVGIEGNQAKCVWTDLDGQLESGVFPVDLLRTE